jgi:hypothetical protein
MPEDDLPFPVAAWSAMVAARRTALGRVKSLLDGIEGALRLVVAIELGVLRETAGPELMEQAATMLIKAAQLGGPWEHVALRLAALIPDKPADAVLSMARALSRTKVKSTPLDEALKKATEIHLSISRQTGLSEDAYAGEEEELRGILDGILTALRPLAKMQLVSVAELLDIDEESNIILYALYLHRGPGEHFPIIRVKLSSRLQKNWCYLLTEDGTRAPIPLAPIVFSQTCKACGRLEVAVAERLTLGPKGATVVARGVTTNHEGSLEILWQKRMEAFHAAVLAARDRESAAASKVLISAEDSLEVTGVNLDVGHLYSTREAVTQPPPPVHGGNKDRARDPRNSAYAVTILFLGANPSDKTRLALGQQVREITQRLRATTHGSKFHIIQEWAVRSAELQACLLRHKPDVIHFSGHGNSEGQILVEDDRGTGSPIDREALGNLFKLLRRNIRCIVLNACYSADQADEIAQHIDCVIGMSTAIQDAAAINFAGAFYQAIGFGASIQLAFDLGCNQLDLQSLAEADAPRLVLRRGVNPAEICFVGGGE